MVGGYAVEPTNCLSFGAAPDCLGCPSSTARADSPSIRWGNRPAPATCDLESRSSTQLGSVLGPCIVVTPTMLDYIPLLRKPGLLRTADGYACAVRFRLAIGLMLATACSGPPVEEGLFFATWHARGDAPGAIVQGVPG